MLPKLVIGEFEIPSFFLVINLIVSGLIILGYFQAIKQKQDLKHFFNITLLLLLGSFLGARVFHIFYEDWDFYKKDPIQALYFWQGGFVFYGGFIFCFASGWLYCRWQKISFFKQADFFTPFFAAGYALGRLGCFLNGCCFGKFCDLPWAIEGRHPTQIYAFLLELGILFFLLFQKSKKLRPGKLFLSWMALHSLARMVIETFRDDPRGDFILNFSVSWWMSLLILILSVLALKNLSRFKQISN